ncbi:hypothetical protein X727_33400 [Mesorhizobium sp. L103C119B0]|nr:hypothetical protein X727_33400 [Mesorhizobium sp. L103C119B0]
MVAMARPGAVHHAADVAVELDVGEVVDRMRPYQITACEAMDRARLCFLSLQKHKNEITMVVQTLPSIEIPIFCSS